MSMICRKFLKLKVKTHPTMPLSARHNLLGTENTTERKTDAIPPLVELARIELVNLTLIKNL